MTLKVTLHLDIHVFENPLPKKCFVASLVEYGPVVPIDYRQSDLETGQNLIRKAQEEKLLTALQGSII